MFNREKVAIDELLRQADGFQGNFDEALDYINERLDSFEDLHGDIKLYRVIFVESIKNINLKELGNHWVENDSDLNTHFLDYLQNECFGETLSGKPYILEATFDIKDIDYESTLHQNVLNPHENEWFIKSDSKPIGLIKVKTPDSDEYLPIKSLLKNLQPEPKFEFSVF